MTADALSTSFRVDATDGASESRRTSCIDSKVWVIHSVLAMMCWGVCNFCYGIIAELGQSGANGSAAFIGWACSAVIGVVCLIIDGSSVWKYGRKEVCLCFLSGVVCCMASLAMSLGIAACPDSKGAVTAVKPTQFFIVCLLSFVFFGEKITLSQSVGMLGALIGLAMMALADTGKDAMIGLSLGFVCAQCYGIANFVVKHVTVHSDKPMSPAVAIGFSNLSTGFVGIVALVAMFASGRGLEGMHGERSWLVLVAVAVSFVGYLGAVSMGRAFKAGGPAGVVVTITNSQAVVVLMLDIIFFTPNLDPLILSGMAIVILSVGFLSSLSPRSEKS